MKKKQSINKPDSSNDSLVKTHVFGVDITNEKIDKVLEFVGNSLEKRDEQYYVTTPNPEIIVYAHNHPAFRSILNTAKIALCDGMQLFRAAAFVGKPLRSRITGVDFMECLCKYISKKPITVGFLGGRGGVAKKTAECLIAKYPGLDVAFIGEEPEDFVNYEGKHRTKNSGNESKLKPSQSKTTDILFVAFGFPKQEEWIFKNLSKSHVTVMMGVGGAFDYLSQKVSRAPLWIQNLGFEWLYRLVRQPWRWRRQLALIQFVWIVMRERLHSGI